MHTVCGIYFLSRNEMDTHMLREKKTLETFTYMCVGVFTNTRNRQTMYKMGWTFFGITPTHTRAHTKRHHARIHYMYKLHQIKISNSHKNVNYFAKNYGKTNTNSLLIRTL